MTKPCVRPAWSDFRKSPWLTSDQFESRLVPHTPYLCHGDLLEERGVIKPCFGLNGVEFDRRLNHSYGYKFLPNFTNTLYSVLYRILAEPTLPIPKRVPNDISWCHQYGLYFNPDVHIPEYLLNLKAHQKHRILQAYEDWKLSGSFPRSLEVFPKTDELLLGKCKPRIIWNVPPLFQFLLGPVVRQLTIYMKTVFDGKTVHHFRGRSFTLKFGCGLVASDLDEWASHSIEQLVAGHIHWAGIFLGDDTFVLYSKGGKILSLESDFSSYDSTQRSALHDLLFSIYERMGVQSFYIDCFRRVSQLNLKVRYGPQKKFSFKIVLTECQTATGKSDTCVGNSLIAIHSTIYYMCGLDYSVFGLVAKLVHHDTWYHGTFLKGFWCLGVDGLYHWSYLPSMALKLCKGFDVNRTCEVIMESNFSSLGFSDAPILRVLSARFMKTPTRKDDFHITNFTQVKLDSGCLAAIMIDRYSPRGYNIILQLENIISTLPLGSQFLHPGWRLLARRDYGDGVVECP